jgi:hypothetical protein
MELPPLSKKEILDEINSSFKRMSLEQKRLWEIIKITPEKWQAKNFGEEVGGFWVVAIFGKQVIWYNEIEEGFNVSKYHNYGKLSEVWANQDELEWVIQNLLNELNGSYDQPNNLISPE